MKNDETMQGMTELEEDDLELLTGGGDFPDGGYLTAQKRYPLNPMQVNEALHAMHNDPNSPYYGKSWDEVTKMIEWGVTP